MFESVLFDFDGTLAPNLDLPDMRRQIASMTQAHNVPESVYADLYIVEIIEAAQAWLNTNTNADLAEEYAASAHQRITDIEINSARQTQPFDGMRDMLTQLRQLGTKTGVVTRNCSAAVLTVFPDLHDYVDAVVCRDDTIWLKPDPRHLTTCLDQIGGAAKRSVMVGDGHLDMSSGKNAGLYCIGVLSGSSDEPSLVAAGADLVIPRLSATSPWAHWGSSAFQSR